MTISFRNGPNKDLRFLAIVVALAAVFMFIGRSCEAQRISKSGALFHAGDMNGGGGIIRRLTDEDREQQRINGIIN